MTIQDMEKEALITMIQAFHKALYYRREMDEEAIDAARQTGDHEAEIKNVGRMNEVKEVMRYMEKHFPGCSEWEV